MNDYSLGSSIDACEISMELYKTVAERNTSSRKKYSLALKSYKEGNYRTATLIFSELAEEGHQFADVNSGLLFNNYPIFNNQTFNDYNSYKYFSRQLENRDILSLIYLADMYYTG